MSAMVSRAIAGAVPFFAMPLVAASSDVAVKNFLASVAQKRRQMPGTRCVNDLLTK